MPCTRSSTTLPRRRTISRNTLTEKVKKMKLFYLLILRTSVEEKTPKKKRTHQEAIGDGEGTDEGVKPVGMLIFKKKTRKAFFIIHVSSQTNLRQSWGNR